MQPTALLVISCGLYIHWYLILSLVCGWSLRLRAARDEFRQLDFSNVGLLSAFSAVFIIVVPQKIKCIEVRALFAKNKCVSHVRNNYSFYFMSIFKKTVIVIPDSAYFSVQLMTNCAVGTWKCAVVKVNFVKFGRLILRTIIKILVSRCQILRLKCTKFDFGWGYTPDPAGGAYSAPLRPPIWI